MVEAKSRKFIQIRVFVEQNSYNEVKKEAKDLRLELGRLAGLKLSGYKITKE